MAKCLAEFGPNINQVARESGKFKETVRYRYHKFFVDRGIKIQAIPSYPKLGFKRLVMFARLAPAYSANPKLIFDIMAELGYLHSFTRILLSEDYVVHVAVPAELKENCIAGYRALRDEGLFSELKVLEFDEMRNAPMQPRFFDFVKGVWSFDWAAGESKVTKLPLSIPPRVVSYDKIDLLILKEFEIDAGRTLARIAANVGVNLNALEFHCREHVMPRGLIKGYRLVWQGTNYDPIQKESVSRKDLYIELTILLTDCEKGDVAELMLLLNSTPFLWSEAYSQSSYCAEIFAPNYAYQALLEHIDKFAKRVGEKLHIYIMDQSEAMRFVIGYPMFDGEARKWRRVNPTSVLSAVEKIRPAVREKSLNS